MPLPYPPPYQDLATLAEHVCMGERTIEEHVKDGIFPSPIMQGGKRVWVWKTVVKHYADKDKNKDGVPLSPSQQREGNITDATRKEIARAHAKA